MEKYNETKTGTSELITNVKCCVIDAEPFPTLNEYLKKNRQKARVITAELMEENDPVFGSSLINAMDCISEMSPCPDDFPDDMFFPDDIF